MKKILSFASLLVAAVMLISCGEIDVTTDTITLKCDKDVIKCDGIDVSTFSLIADDGTVIKDGIEIFDEATEASIGGVKFSTEKEGEYTFWASYKTYISNKVTIKAINADIPSVAADPQPSNTSFAKKVFLTQFTGTGCGYCPLMVYAMNNAFAQGGTGDKVVIAASHSYSSSDPAYISAPGAGNFGGQGYPYLVADMAIGYADYTKTNMLVDIINDRYSEPAKAGISINPVFAEKLLPSSNGTLEDYIIARVSVKAAESGEYTLGAWLLEDGIYGIQSDYAGMKKEDSSHDYDTHNNCLRVADSKNGTSWIGHDMGYIEAGKTAEKTFLLKVKSSWKLENMHMAVFVCAKNTEGRYSVNNVVDCPVDAPTPFSYK